jgi:hypothetical protein
MAIIVFETTSPSAAEDIVTAVGAGELWGLDMGTTSKASSYSNFALVECTRTRSENLADYIPDGTAQILWDSEPPSFTSADISGKTWYLRGMLP